MRKTKAQKGITLIALIITIVVLLILAVVAIRAVQDGGIIQHTLNARNTHEEEKAKEKVMLVLNEWKIAKEMPGANFENFLTEKFGEENATSNGDGTYTVIVDGYEVIVDEEGSIIEEVITTYTAEEIEADEHLYAIGKTVSTYVVAKFNDDYTQVTITKNGEDSDGLIMDFAEWSKSPMQNNASTLETAIIQQGITNTGGYIGPDGNGAFAGCTGLRSITIPSSVTSIGRGTFYGCTNLTNITIPNSVTGIETSAFQSCTGLTSINISNSVTSISIRAFSNLATNSIIYCQTQAVADLFVDGKNYTAANTSVVVDASKF